jgi:hypothetical protein
MKFDRRGLASFAVWFRVASAITLAVGCRSVRPERTDGNPPRSAIYQTSMGPDGQVHTELVREAGEEEAAKGMVTTIAAGPRQHAGPADQPQPHRPPDVEPGKTVILEWTGEEPVTGEVLEVDGSWVKMRFQRMQQGPQTGEGGWKISSGSDKWINFDEVRAYKLPKVKK